MTRTRDPEKMAKLELIIRTKGGKIGISRPDIVREMQKAFKGDSEQSLIAFVSRASRDMINSGLIIEGTPAKRKSGSGWVDRLIHVANR